MNNRPAIRGTGERPNCLPTPKELNKNSGLIKCNSLIFNSFGVGMSLYSLSVDFIYGYSHSILSGF
jgi:hypothetical protein